ncbi:MAG: Dihydrofolate reductase [Chthoniobacteraceae bacterium]|nr:Dihydrofolate reductase [Chthoniobacteraceae bacterium]
MKAIAAMSLNRVIGNAGRMPWHLPEDFKWFRKTTLGHVVLMGRKTFESLGKALPNRINLVATRDQGRFPDAIAIPDLEESLRPFGKEIFVIGGAEIYAQLLPRCTDLYLSVVQREVEGDAFFPPFEDRFELIGTILEHPDFKVLHYRNPDVKE